MTSDLSQSQERFEKTVRQALGKMTVRLPLDVSPDGSLEDVGETLASRELPVDGVLHAIAMDRTIRGGVARPLGEP